MNRMQKDVAYFNEAVKTPRGDAPEMRATELRARLIAEEAAETVVAMLGCGDGEAILQTAADKATKHTGSGSCSEPDIVEAIDGLCDLLYVVFGAFDAFGVDAEPYFQAVHEANMTKLGGPKDEHGKQLKPPGFVPPQDMIRALLIAAGWSGR